MGICFSASWNLQSFIKGSQNWLDYESVKEHDFYSIGKLDDSLTELEKLGNFFSNLLNGELKRAFSNHLFNVPVIHFIIDLTLTAIEKMNKLKDYKDKQ